MSQQPFGREQYRAWENSNGVVEPSTERQPGYQMQPAPGYQVPKQHAPAGKLYGLHGAEPFWYVLGCISFGAAYFSKIPAKKAACEIVSELQLDGQGPSQGYRLTSAQTFWYVLMCISFGCGYFAKVSAKKALWEVVTLVQSAAGDHTAAIGRALFAHQSPYRS
jgi:hypothetical protein